MRISGLSDGLRPSIVFHVWVENRDEDPAPPSQFGEFCEVAFDGVELRTRCWREAEIEALVSIEPSSHVGMFVGGLVVEDHIHGFARRHLERVEEANKLLMTMALHIASDHGSVDLVKGGKQHCGTVVLVIVGLCSSTSLHQGKSAVESLDLALSWMACAGGST